MTHYLKFDYFEQAYRDLLALVLHEGTDRDVRGFKTREISPMLLVTDNPLQNILSNPTRKINKSFMVAEFLWIATGGKSIDIPSFYNSQIGRFSDDGESFAGAYGPKIEFQRQYILDCFKKDINTRQAIITIWERNPGPSKDIPCTVSMQFLHREGFLDLIVNMRSNDLWLGLPYDFYNFTMLLNLIACELGLKVGRYSHVAGSLHLYDQHYLIANDAAKDDSSMASLIKSDVMISNELFSLADAESEMRVKGSTDIKLKHEPWISMKTILENRCVQIRKA